MLAYATSLAAQKGLKLPRGLKSNGAICRAFLDQHAPTRSHQRGELEQAKGGPRLPSEAMLRFAQALARERGIECPPEVVSDFTACKAFLDAHAGRKDNGVAAGRRTSAQKRRGKFGPSAERATIAKTRYDSRDAAH
jgi:DNA topoisomerase III